jgi:hypothetical protein
VVGTLVDEISWLGFNEDGTLLMTLMPSGQGMMLWGVPSEASATSELRNPVPVVPDIYYGLTRNPERLG